MFTVVVLVVFSHWLISKTFTLNLGAIWFAVGGIGSLIATTLQLLDSVVDISCILSVFLLSWRVPWRSK